MPNSWKIGFRAFTQGKQIDQTIADENKTAEQSDYEVVKKSGLFDEDWYLAMNADVAASGMDPIVHHLEFGWKEGRNPSPRFDAARYVSQYPDAREATAGPFVHYVRVGRQKGYAIHDATAPINAQHHEDDALLSEACREIERSGLFDRDLYLSSYPDVAGCGMDPLRHYVEFGWREERRPSSFVDTSWYLENYPDVRQAGVNPLLHYVRHGQKEGRSPNFLFDSDWYNDSIMRTPDEKDQSAYAIFRSRGLAAGDAPLPELKSLYECRGAVPEAAEDQYVRLVTAAHPWWHRFGRGKFAILVALFSPFEKISDEGRTNDDPIDQLIAFLNSASLRDADPGPLFRANHYKQIIGERGVAVLDGEIALQHFLREGFDKRIVPTPHFDERYYYAKYHDIDRVKMWAFEHFIRWGVFEGRRAVSGPPLPVVAQWSSSLTETEVRLNNWKRFLASCGTERGPGQAFQETTHYFQLIQDMLGSATFAETMWRANLIEPALGDASEIDEVLVPPLHDGRNLARRALRELFKRDHYDTIVCVPWIRTGGADLVACQVCEAVRRARPDESVLLLRTDHPNFEQPEWIPADIDVVDASKIFRALSRIDAQMLLYGAFMGLTPSRVINVNSRLCWETMVRFGTRLAGSIDLYSYLFCWDQTSNGHRTGYPSEFFPETANILRATFTDTFFLKSELTKIYNLPESISRRIVPLLSPARRIIEGLTVAEESVTRAAQRTRQRILWAGRLDRQKRFDLVQDIARRMPNVDFLCWGGAALDAPPDHSRSPENLILKGSFSFYDELPLKDADLWLFTSEWEGMPTILIEVAHRGVCVVASSVGGVPELIDDETGWPVKDFGNVDAYIDTVRAALADPRERISRAQRLRERARSRHSMPAYVQQLSDVLNSEVRV